MPKGIRPTQNKVRKAIFDILGDMEGLRFLELFAGSGAVGIEALSRGAKEAVFVESDSVCVRTLKDNLSSLGVINYELRAQNAERAIEMLTKAHSRFDIIFMDPPYYKDSTLRHLSGSKAASVESLSKKALQMLISCDILAPDGLIAVQHFKKDNLPYSAGDLVLLKQAVYGDTVLSFYSRG